MIYLQLFLLFSQFLLANGAQIMVEIEPNWMPLPEYRSLLEPEQFREVFQSKRFELQIYKEAIQEGISIAGTRVAKERDVFGFENIPEDWMEPTGVVLEIKLPPILSVTKLLLNEESFYHPRIRRPFRILRNRTNMIYGFTILEYPERIFRLDIQLPMGETPKGGNEVAYMESLNNSLTKLEQSEQLCAQTKYECNLNLLLKYTHVERRFDAFLKAAQRQTLTVSTQNFATIKAKSVKLFSDIMKLTMVVLEEEKKIFKENASSSIDLYNNSPSAIPTLQLDSQHQHGQNSSQSSRTHQTQTPTTGASSSAAAGVLPMNRKITFKMMPIERIAQVLAGLQLHPPQISQPRQTKGISGLHPATISQPSQINIPAGTNQERMKFIISDFLSPNSLNSNPIQSAHFHVAQQQQQQNQREAGQTSLGDSSAGQTQAKEKRTNPSFDDDQNAALWRHLVRFEDVLFTEQADVARHKEEDEERSKLVNSKRLTPRQIAKWIYNKKSRLSKNSVIIHQQFESEKRKYQAEIAAIGGAGKDKASASASAPPVDLNLNLEQSNPEEEEDKMQEDD